MVGMAGDSKRPHKYLWIGNLPTACKTPGKNCANMAERENGTYSSCSVLDAMDAKRTPTGRSLPLLIFCVRHSSTP